MINYQYEVNSELSGKVDIDSEDLKLGLFQKSVSQNCELFREGPFVGNNDGLLPGAGFHPSVPSFESVSIRTLGFHLHVWKLMTSHTNTF